MRTGSLNPKSLKKPYIVRLADGSFEIHALRIEGDGQAEENETELCFKSADLVVYEEMSDVTALALHRSRMKPVKRLMRR